MRLAETSARTEETARQIAASRTADLHSANLDLADALESRKREHQSGLDGERRRDSSGLGLAIGRSLIEAMDDELMAQSAGPGTGSTFRIILQSPEGHSAEKRLASLTSPR